MSKYFETKKGSLEDMVAGVTEGKQSEDYKQLFKKELEKAGKGIGAMSDQEKKDFFNKIDKKHTAKNEDSKKVQKMNVKKSSGEKLKEETELEEGAVKDFLMDVEADAGDMSLNDLIRKYYGQMGLTAQDIKKIYYRVNEEKEVKDNPTLQESIMNVWSQGAEEQEQREDEAKWLKTEEKKSLNEEKIKCPNCGHMNDAGADKCANCGYDLSKKEGKHEKKKTMTGSPATKVDVKPEVDFDSK
jgi:ribosomal protein L37E|tara:strand:- start:140 stop:868 length:729 start_codon:yes stop_codon:yes gene_type:complete